MAGKVTFGNNKMQRAIKEYTEDIEKDVKRVVVGTAQLLQSEAKARAPIDDGSLRDSIEMDVLNDGMSASVRVTTFYAIFVELGTGIYAAEGNGRQTPWTYYSHKLGRFVTTRGMRPQPFWYPSVDAAERYFNSEMRKIG